MNITEIERNAVLFPFIEGYISDGNFYKYFHGTPYDQLPFEATIKMDGYLKDFGLTENEKEIWWDIYVIKVIDAINERDLKIINNYGELNESTEDIYNKIANSVAKQQKFFDHILKTLVDETQVQTMKDWMPDDDTYEQKVWVTPPFLNHRIDLPGERDESVGWNEFSYFGYGYARYMRDIYGLTDKEGLKIWGLYYKALQKKVEELIERDRIIYGDD